MNNDMKRSLAACNELSDGNTPDGNSSYAPTQSPSDVKFFAGFGATEDDLRRGFLEPDIRSNPEYDLDNYKQRSSYTNRTPDQIDAEFEFRNQNNVSRGFLNRNSRDRNR